MSEPDRTDMWRLVHQAPKDSDDPTIIAARRRMERGLEISPLVAELGRQPWFVDNADAPGVIEGFRAAGCDIKELDVRGMDEDGLVAQLGVVYEFPDYYGQNWTAYSDCYSMMVASGENPIILAVRGLDAWKDSDFPMFFRAVHELEWVTRLWDLSRRIIARRVVNLYIGDWD